MLIGILNIPTIGPTSGITVTENDINSFIEEDLIAMNNYDLADAYEEENIDISSIIEVNLDETDTIDYLDNTTDDPYDLFVE